MNNDIVAIIAGLVSVIAVIVTLITASTSAKSTALAELQKVVDLLQVQMKKQKDEIDEQKTDISSLKKELAKERKLRMMYEDYIQVLILKMREKEIEPPAISEYVKDDESY